MKNGGPSNLVPTSNPANSGPNEISVIKSTVETNRKRKFTSNEHSIPSNDILENAETSAKIKKLENNFWCKICKIQFESDQRLIDHMVKNVHSEHLEHFEHSEYVKNGPTKPLNTEEKNEKSENNLTENDKQSDSIPDVNSIKPLSENFDLRNWFEPIEDQNMETNQKPLTPKKTVEDQNMKTSQKPSTPTKTVDIIFEDSSDLKNKAKKAFEKSKELLKAAKKEKLEKSNPDGIPESENPITFNEKFENYLTKKAFEKSKELLKAKKEMLEKSNPDGIPESENPITVNENFENSFTNITNFQESNQPGIKYEPIKLDKFSYQCPICLKIMVTRNLMEIHIRVHTGEKPFHCPFCKRSYAQKGNCKLHILSQHNQLNQPIYRLNDEKFVMFPKDQIEKIIESGPMKNIIEEKSIVMEKSEMLPKDQIKNVVENGPLKNFIEEKNSKSFHEIEKNPTDEIEKNLSYLDKEKKTMIWNPVDLNEKKSEILPKDQIENVIENCPMENLVDLNKEKSMVLAIDPVENSNKIDNTEKLFEFDLDKEKKSMILAVDPIQNPDENDTKEIHDFEKFEKYRFKNQKSEVNTCNNCEKSFSVSGNLKRNDLYLNIKCMCVHEGSKIKAEYVEIPNGEYIPNIL